MGGKEREGQKEGGKRKEKRKEQSERQGGDATDSAGEKNQKIKEGSDMSNRVKKSRHVPWCQEKVIGDRDEEFQKW